MSKTTEADKIFSFKPRSLTRDERTTLVAKQILQDETDKQQALKKRLKAARIAQETQATRE